MSQIKTRTQRLQTLLSWVILAALIFAAFASTKFVSPDEAAQASGGEQFDPAAFAAEHYETDIVPGITENAVDLNTVISALSAGQPESDFGNSSGTDSSYSIPVMFTGIAGEPQGGLLPVTVEGVPSDIVVQVQIGPALNGTALRDVTGKVTFDQFTNQLEFQKVATELNNQAKLSALANFDSAGIAGKQISVIGAYTRVNPNLISVVPVVIEVK